MRVAKVGNRLFEVTASRVVDADKIHADLSYMEKRGMLTFGDQTTRVLSDTFEKRGYELAQTDLCYPDDLSIGLEMPATWYLNRGLYALSISMYFNFLNYKEMAKAGELYEKNASISQDFGRIAAIEVYLEQDLRAELDGGKKRYFGTPRTLTECMRVLEGWDLQQIPRLRRYVTYANFIRLWCSINFPDFDESLWGIGKQASKAILEATGTTNVRQGIMYFWSNYLEKRDDRVAPEDIEIDILDPDFHMTRAPRYVLLGEDIFAEESLNTGSEMVFRSFSESMVLRYPRNVGGNDDLQRKTAALVQERFPSTTVIMFKNPASMPSFTMTKLDEVKEGVSREVAVVASGVCHVDTMLGGSNGS